MATQSATEMLFGNEIALFGSKIDLFGNKSKKVKITLILIVNT